MTENPYAPPRRESDPDLAQGSVETPTRDLGGRLDTAAKMTVVSCGSWFGMMLVGRLLDENAPALVDMLGFYAFFTFAPAMGLYGAFCMLRRDQYRMSLIGATCMTLPVFGPWCGLTVPLGIWSLALLRRESIRNEFALAVVANSQGFENAEDAIAAAAKMDKSGEWDAAIDRYSDVACRWPEHANYIDHCIADIRKKQAACQ